MRDNKPPQGQMERPILFNAPMVRALLEGRKTQTRRIIKPQPAANPLAKSRVAEPLRYKQFAWFEGGSMPDIASACPYGQPGDRLWVRETWLPLTMDSAGLHIEYSDGAISAVQPDPDFPRCVHYPSRLKPSIHMPRWASRITLEITKIRVERLQEISEEDALAEGVEYHQAVTARSMFHELWNSINGVGAWDKNPWVWVISFCPRH